MGIRFQCPNGHKINVKSFLAGKRALCPECGVKVVVPMEAEAAPTLSLATVPGSNGTVSNGTAAAPVEFKQPVAGTAANVAAPVAKSTAPTAAPVSAHVAKPIASPAFNANLAAAAAVVSAPVAPAMPTPPAFGIADPIAEAPQAVWYVRPRTGGQFGPAPGDIFRQWIAQRRVTGDSLVWRDGWADWRVASEVLPQLSAKAPPAFAGMPGVPTPAVAMPGHAVAAGAADPSSSQATKYIRSRKSKSSTIVAICVLGVVAIALVGVLIFVLNRPTP
jgi:hypothetical protein